MKFFEVSAKNSDGIDDMFYNCIIKLPFFQQFNEDEKNLIEELEKNNKNKIVNQSFLDILKNNNNSNNIPNMNKPVLNVNQKEKENIDENNYKDFVHENGEKCNC